MPVKRGGKKNRKSNKNRKSTSKCKSHKRGHRAPEAEKERIEQHKLVNAFKTAASTNLFKASLPHKFTKADNLRKNYKKWMGPAYRAGQELSENGRNINF